MSKTKQLLNDFISLLKEEGKSVEDNQEVLKPTTNVSVSEEVVEAPTTTEEVSTTKTDTDKSSEITLNTIDTDEAVKARRKALSEKLFNSLESADSRDNPTEIQKQEMMLEMLVSNTSDNEDKPNLDVKTETPTEDSKVDVADALRDFAVNKYSLSEVEQKLLTEKSEDEVIQTLGVILELRGSSQNKQPSESSHRQVSGTKSGATAPRHKSLGERILTQMKL